VPKILIFLSIFIPTLLIAAGLTIASVALSSLTESSQALECFCPSCPATAFSEKGAAVLGLVKVDVQGAVKKPGVYQLEIGQRVADLLALAGGFAKDADQAYVAKTLNLSTELKNQDKIYIPFFEENKIASSPAAQSSSDSNLNNSNLVSINQADSTKLQSLAGIGEVRAQAIIDNRPYSNLEELVSKDVLSESIFSGLKAQLSL
jgi:competence protein ComEA